MTTKAIISKVDWDTIFATAKPDKNNSNALNVSVSCAKIFQYENDVIKAEQNNRLLYFFKNWWWVGTLKFIKIYSAD